MKTKPITCQGYKKDEKGNIVYAEGHEAIRFVDEWEKNVTRCAACQKAFAKIRTSSRAKARREKKDGLKIEKLVLAIQEWKKNGVWGKMTKVQQSYYESLIPVKQ